MEKDIDRVPKNSDTDIVIRIDEFGGKRGVTIREFWRGERYTGFTKAGTKIPAEHFKAFKDAINSIDEKDLMENMDGGSGNDEIGGGPGDGEPGEEPKSPGPDEPGEEPESGEEDKEAEAAI
jgi:hypothetical protein